MRFQNVQGPDAELKKLLEDSKNAPPVSEEVLREQRISFAYGNAMNSSLITKESVRLAARSMGLLP
jgi:hypothetical protein